MQRNIGLVQCQKPVMITKRGKKKKSELDSDLRRKPEKGPSPSFSLHATVGFVFFDEHTHNAAQQSAVDATARNMSTLAGK